MKKAHVATGAIVIIAALVASHFSPQKPVEQPVVLTKATSTAEVVKTSVKPVSSLTVASDCDPSLWQHVYTGDPRKFQKPQDRLQVIEDCKTVEGVIVNAKAEADGDFHIRLDVQDKTLLNAKNISGQKGYLVLEPVCGHGNPVTQRDTVQEGVCNGFEQTVFNPSMVGKKVKVTGVYVTDMEHGWNEIHPVSSIVVE